MATIRITRDTLIKGVPAFAGDIVEVDDADGRLLVSYKLAEHYNGDEEGPADEPEKPVDDDLSTTPTKKKRR